MKLQFGNLLGFDDDPTALLFGGPDSNITETTLYAALMPTTPASSLTGSVVVSATPVATGTTTGGTSATASWISGLSDATIKADMQAADVSGAVSEAGMAKLFTDLSSELSSNKTTLSSSQFNDLNTIAADLNVGETASGYLTYIVDAEIDGSTANAYWTGGGASTSVLGNLAVGETAAKLTELTDKWFLGTDLPTDVVRMSGVATFDVSYSNVSLPLYATSGPTMSDVNQGYLGDCYLLAVLAEVADHNASSIESMITNNGNGTYGVRFYVDGVARYVTVNSQLPDAGTIFNSGSDMWASLIEKAYAQVQALGVITGNGVNDGNSFSTIGNGGMAEDTLEEVTGASSITDFSGGRGSWNEYVYTDTEALQTSHNGLTTTTVMSDLVADLAAGFDVVLASYTNAEVGGRETLIADHEMSIYGYDSSTGELEIRNPWGTESGQTWDTTFEVSLSTLLSASDTITVDNVTSSTVLPVTTNVTVSAAVALQASALVTSFTIADSSANVVAAVATMAGYTKLTSITFTDSSEPSLSLTYAQYGADAAVLALIVSAFKLTVTGASASEAAALQSRAMVSAFTVSDSSADVLTYLSNLEGDSKLTSVSLTDSNALTLTYSQFAGATSLLAKLPASYTVTVSGATAAEATALQANTHVASFTVLDSAANVTADRSALAADSKLKSLVVTGTAGSDTLNLTGVATPASINLDGDSAKAVLTNSALSFIGTPDAITFGTGLSTVDFTVGLSAGIETIANFQFGVDYLDLTMTGTAKGLLQAHDTMVNGVKAIALYSSTNTSAGVVLTGVSSSMSAASLMASHVTYSGMAAVIS